MAELPHHTGARSPEYALLGLLYERPNHGYTLHQLLTTELGFVWHVSQSQVYSILKRLETQGKITATTQKQEKLPSRKVLQITDRGRQQFEEWLRTPAGSSVRSIRLEFITRLYFAKKLFPKLIPAIIKGEIEELDGALSRLGSIQTAIPAAQAFNHLSLELRIQQLRAVRDWVIRCRKALR